MTDEVTPRWRSRSCTSSSRTDTYACFCTARRFPIRVGNDGKMEKYGAHHPVPNPRPWIPDFSGMTAGVAGMTVKGCCTW